MIAHVDHGKSTLTDALVARAGFIIKPELARYTSTRADEPDCDVGVKFAGAPLYFDFDFATEKAVDLAAAGELRVERTCHSPRRRGLCWHAPPPPSMHTRKHVCISFWSPQGI